MSVGSDRSLSERNSTLHNRTVGPKALLCALALVLAVVVHAQPFPSVPLDTTRYIGRDLRVQPDYFAAAASPSGGIIAWTNCNDHVFASRLTGSMDVVDTIPVDATGPWLLSYTAPVVACSDSGYAVAWRGCQATVSSYEWPWIALISDSGEVASRVPLDTGVQVHSLGVAARSNRYVVVYDGWFPATQSLDVRAVEVGLDGAILRRSVVAHGGDTTPFVDSSVVTRGDSAYFAVWMGPSSGGSYDINGRLLWPDSTSADTQVVSIRSGCRAFRPRVAFDGARFWVGWLEETTPDAETVAKVARVSQSGVLLDTGGILVGGHATGIDLAAAGETTFVALGMEDGSVVGLRYDADAQSLDSTPIVLATVARRPSAVAAAADTFLVVWSESVGSVLSAGWRHAGRRVTAAGTVLDTQARDYALAANSHEQMAMASDGDNFLAIWSDVRTAPDYSARFVGRRFDNQGRFLDAEPFTIGVPHDLPLRSALTYGAGFYLLAWCEDEQDTESTTTYATRISRDGYVLDTIPIPLSCSTYSIRQLGATYLHDSMFVVSLDHKRTTCSEVVRVMADGRVLDSVPRKLKVRWGLAMTNEQASIASHGDTLVMACRVDSGNYIRVWLAVGQYDSALRQYDSTWWEPRRPLDFRTSVACGGGRILAVEDIREIKPPYLYLLDSAANLLDTAPVPNPPEVIRQRFYAEYDGASFLCVNTREAGRNQALQGYRVSTDGELLDPYVVGLVEFESTYVTENVALAADSLGHVGLAFFSYEPSCLSSRARAAVFPRLTGGIESPRASGGPNRLQLSPDPSNGIVWLDLPDPAEGPPVVAVRDIAGRVRTEVSLSPASADRGRTMLDLRHLPAGVYFLETAGGRRRCKLVIARSGGVP